ncbi:hypothetical protein LSTR_LSTR012796 [Laodelphax striatellus]|uniref:Uncharacterized protein n=1 Tax=Laodelphax striatellus TaxID=195883 RepID=A0A482X004_LAOST|nr:hypothetical protein LSTR_LSTR012796 [Laodelphax striatellus]
MSSVRRIPQLAQLVRRRFATTSNARQNTLRAEDTSAFKKLKQDQETFNSGMGPEEVYLQGGLKDVLLFRTTVFLTVVSTLLSGKVIYEMAQK